ncbi:MAG: hypothetical protein NC305_13275 [Lachnospiraceae bacterium]|nr:hypothetical protein [Butyrivibrio sp.]MCM1344031.1 hypothetical protein [Muribaculaceae bacterium]MCM1411502.1 hypothetical protein [Lachnospiraceae bacterium]
MGRILLGNVKGPQGEQGVSAYDLAVKGGFSGTEAEWLEALRGEKGDNGDSAYAVAVKNGFPGTESEWLESLKGDPGTPGEPEPAGTCDILSSSDAVKQNTSAGKIVDALVIKEFFQSVSDGKAMLASAITGKGVPTDAGETFQGMAENISAITSGGGGSGSSSMLSLCMYEIGALEASLGHALKEKTDITILSMEG